MFQNKKPNWNETDVNSDAYILNKPTIPAAQVQADWDESDSSDVAFILNKPALATVATSGSYNDLSNKPTIPDNIDYLYFSAGQTNSTVRLDKHGSPDAIQLEYSTDNKQSWTDYAWTDSTGDTITLANSGDGVYFRAKSTNAHMGKGWSDFHQFVLTGIIYASGNIMSLLDKTCMLNEITDNWCFVYLFGGANLYNNKLYSAPKLPATKLTGIRCYDNMFQYDTYLSKAPELPATILSESCYDSLFSGCTSLVSVPDFPIASLTTGCFTSMYENCTALTDMPKIPNVTLAQNCFSNMFRGCTNLVNTTEIRTNSMATGCFNGMFSYCSALKVAPKIVINTYVGSAMTQMFYNCQNLEDADTFENPIDITKDQIMWETFYQCPKLKHAPNMTGTTAGYQGFIRTFAGCTSLKYLKTTQTNWNNQEWLDGASATGIFDCPASLDTTTRDVSHVPAGWTVTHGSNEPSDDTTSTVEAMSTDVYTVCAGSTETGVLTVDSALTLNAGTVASGKIAYAEVVLDVAAGATVTAGSNITFVDTLTAGKRNVCVVRWSGGTARLYVTITEDLDESASN